VIFIQSKPSSSGSYKIPSSLKVVVIFKTKLSMSSIYVSSEQMLIVALFSIETMLIPVARLPLPDTMDVNLFAAYPPKYLTGFT
jgi:hypothetical protein